VLAIMATALVVPVSSATVRVAEVIGLLLAGIGLAAVGAEAGRPLRGINVFRHLRRSWMSREALAAAAFGVLIGLDVVVPGPRQRGLGAAAALGFILSQGFILYAAKGVPAWATWELPVLFMTSALTKGLGVVLVLLAVVGEMKALAMAGELAAGVILVDVLAWWVYAEADGSRAKEESLRRLRAPGVAAAVLGLGHVLPLIPLVMWLAAGGPPLGAAAWAAAIACGVCMVAGGGILKWAVVRRAGMLHPLGLVVVRSGSLPVAAGAPSRSAMGSSHT
jgi:phenylacetyl-CoA:acceptor oxidoreductase subunit 2